MLYRYDAGADILVVDLSPQERWTIPFLCTTDGKTVLRLTGATVTGIEMLHASKSYPVDWLNQKVRSEPADQVMPAVPGVASRSVEQPVPKL